MASSSPLVLRTFNALSTSQLDQSAPESPSVSACVLLSRVTVRFLVTGVPDPESPPSTASSGSVPVLLVVVVVSGGPAPELELLVGVSPGAWSVHFWTSSSSPSRIGIPGDPDEVSSCVLGCALFFLSVVACTRRSTLGGGGGDGLSSGSM